MVFYLFNYSIWGGCTIMAYFYNKLEYQNLDTLKKTLVNINYSDDAILDDIEENKFFIDDDDFLRYYSRKFN